MGMAREISLTNGVVAVVDDQDYEWLNAFRWVPIAGRRGAVYAMRTAKRIRADGTLGWTSRQMQRDVLDPDWTAPRSMLVDHIDGNTLDCRRSNLRWATYEESNRNRRIHLRNKSGYRGVYQRAPDQGFVAQVHADGRRRRSPVYATPEEAALAYNYLALKYHGKDAVLNVVPGEVVLRPGLVRSGSLTEIIGWGQQGGYVHARRAEDERV